MRLQILVVGGLLLLGVASTKAGNVPGRDDCWICGKPIITAVYMWMDEVAGVKRHVCELCGDLPNTCYLCSLPVRTNYSNLTDGRSLCERDVKSVLLDEAAIATVCQKMGPSLDRQFSRYMAFPTNINYHVVDRLTLVDLFKVPGKDYTCPNVLGFTSCETNDTGTAEFFVSILSGQTPAATKSTCAHEFTHAWMMANLPAARQKELNRDAEEGFCELVAYMLLRENREAAQIAVLRTNRYTRGQIDLFIDAEERFGFSDVLDWMKNGETNRLHADEIWRIRELKVAKDTNKPAPATLVSYTPPPVDALPDRLILKSISLGGKTPVALINQCTLGIGETGKVKLAGTNLLIRCTAIRSNSVVVELVGTGTKEMQELRFEKPAKVVSK